MAKIYYEKDADRSVLNGKTVSIIGFGSQGHAHAQNLRDNGVNVIVSEVMNDTNPNYKAAVEAGFEVVSAADAAKRGDIIVVLVPDTIQKMVYENDLKPNLSAGNSLMFAHGFNIHYQFITPSPDIDVWMIAPKGPGHLVREEFVKGAGVPCLVAIHQDATGKALDTALAYGCALGGGRGGIIETTFKEETETDLFGEQTVLCGGSAALVKAGFEILTEAGYQPEIAYFEVLHELKLIVDLYYRGGLSFMNYSVSDTAEYGGYTVGPRVITEESKKAMREALKRIQSGEFAKEWIAEYASGGAKFKKLREAEAAHPVEQVGAELRKMMTWIK
ncbi:MAG TPA: ketol-acid reductoisomerase [Candidatus Hydrogenedentes bacterium]|jgi:ketol-acid reductoisomerase|nr:ketol-acid reductoisomerase [Candidatus Hydrogenedentota bacterium]MDY0030410.1 ketol-acid reductoisomerase [FCB group bacterium]NLT61781.1 ketol-acid reductoisomerase [Candidatus Hydrogenedentota bacterium]HNZ19027.1 ketol-acid reductoisomerase [Candidatus Hydrogenedentota bacterium]HOH34446.1 ketol-acid reductoisomerase [Candidatus Hydrogenedentota bacterium]